MKIVYTVATYYPQKNGVQNVTQKQAEALAECGHEVVVICGNKKNNPDEEKLNGVTILRVDAHNRFIFNMGDKNTFKLLIKRECEGADVLITVCMESFATNWILDELKEIKCKKILYLHGIANFEKLSLRSLGIGDFLYRMVKRIYWKIYYCFKLTELKGYDAIAHIHEHDASLDYFKKKGFDNNYVIYNFVGDEMFIDDDTSIEENKGNYFLNVSNYSTRKNQKFLLESYYLSNTSNGLVLIGSSDNKYYRSIVHLNSKLEKKYGRRNVEILHHITRKQTVRYIKNAFAIVMTSKLEQFPITLIEAMANKKPYITSRVGVVEYLQGGIIYDTRKDLIGALEELGNNAQYYNELGEKGYMLAKEELSISSHVNKMIDMINKVVG